MRGKNLKAPVWRTGAYSNAVDKHGGPMDALLSLRAYPFITLEHNRFLSVYPTYLIESIKLFASTSDKIITVHKEQKAIGGYTPTAPSIHRRSYSYSAGRASLWPMCVEMGLRMFAPYS